MKALAIFPDPSGRPATPGAKRLVISISTPLNPASVRLDPKTSALLDVLV
jgi:hypothetical protein